MADGAGRYKCPYCNKEFLGIGEISGHRCNISDKRWDPRMVKLLISEYKDHQNLLTKNLIKIKIEYFLEK